MTSQIKHFCTRARMCVCVFVYVCVCVCVCVCVHIIFNAGFTIES